jgi:hypothetical protein
MGGRTNRLLVAIAAGLALVVESAIAQERELGSVGIHREFITAAARWIMEAKL